jgi:hypothetical protein
MPVKVACPHCSKDIRLPDDLYNHPAQCPLCKGAFAIRWRYNSRPAAAGPASQAGARLAAPTEAPQAAPVEAGEEERRPCPFCGKQIMAKAVKCRWCREWLRG